MQVATITQVDRGVANLSLRPEEIQRIPAAEAIQEPTRGRELPEVDLLIRVARQVESHRGKRNLDQTGTVHSRRSTTAPQITCSPKRLGRLQNLVDS